MADLFDMKVGGLGFHLTAHMIALAALFVACFAITGYITFRDGSISEKKLSGGNYLLEGESLGAATATSLSMGNMIIKTYTKTYDGAIAVRTAGGGDSLGNFGIVLPIGCIILDGYVQVETVQDVQLGALILETGTNAQCNHNGDGGTTRVTGPTTTLATGVVARSPNFTVIADHQELCVTAANVTVVASGKIVAGVRVLYPPGLAVV